MMRAEPGILSWGVVTLKVRGVSTFMVYTFFSDKDKFLDVELIFASVMFWVELIFVKEVFWEELTFLLTKLTFLVSILFVTFAFANDIFCAETFLVDVLFY